MWTYLEDCLSPLGLLIAKLTNWGANLKNVFLTALEAGKSKIQTLPDLVFDEGLIPGF